MNARVLLFPQTPYGRLLDAEFRTGEWRSDDDETWEEVFDEATAAKAAFVASMSAAIRTAQSLNPWPVTAVETQAAALMRRTIAENVAGVLGLDAKAREAFVRESQ